MFPRVICFDKTTIINQETQNSNLHRSEGGFLSKRWVPLGSLITYFTLKSECIQIY